jgi:capsular exopolysaccharide synthesis family protein
MSNVADKISPKAETSSISYALSSSLVAIEPVVMSEAEAFRALRTNVMARHVREGRRALAVCAPDGAVGCTFVAANLAVGLSQIGIKTLLIDANLRNPTISRLFQPSMPVEGLQQCLTSESEEFIEFIQPNVLPNLSILFAGGTPHNPQELLASNAFSKLMNFCLRDYEMTILDTPPANSCSDVLRVSAVASYSLVVVRRDKTFINDVRTLISQLESHRGRVIGTVMTEA